MFGKYEIVKNISEYFRKKIEVTIPDDQSRNDEKIDQEL